MIAARSRTVGVLGVESMTTVSSGRWAGRASRLCECSAADERPEPNCVRTTRDIGAGLKGKTLVPAGEAVTITRVGAARARRRGASHGPQARACPPCSARRAASGTWPWPCHLPRSRPGLQAVHPDLVGRHHAGRRPGRRRGIHRRRLRGDGLAGSTGRTRSRRSWPPATWPRRRTRR